MATTTTNFGWDIPQSTDLVKDGATAIAALGQDIDTAFVDLKGGSTGQVLAKASNTDLDYSWVTTDDTNAIQNAIVDAKGDLIAASAADTPARLAVGADGEILIADSTRSTGLKYVPPLATLSNPLINAGQDIGQRGTSFTTTGAAQYTLDRWTSRTAAVAGSLVTTREVTNDTTNLPNIQYCVRNRRATGNTNTNALEYYQAVESINSIPYAGKRVTFSFYARRSANFTGTFGAILKSGTGTDEPFVPAFTGNTDVCGSSNQALTTTWTRYSWNGTVATTAKQIGVIFTHTPSGTAGSDDYYEVTGVQVDLGLLDVGTIPTFRRNGTTIQGELAACQRYYWNWKSGTSLTMGIGRYTTATEMGIYTMFPVTMRTAPSLVATTGTNYYQIGADGFNSFTIFQQDTSSAWLYNGSEVSGTSGNTDRVYTNNAAASVSFSAEL